MYNIRIEDIIDLVMSHPELDEADKKHILVSLAKRGFLTQGFYFHQSAEDQDAVELWYRNVDENGMTEHGNTGWNDPNKVIEEYLKTKQNQIQK